MKKLFTLCLGMLAVMAIHAQSDFPVQFADKDGNIIADGTTLNLTEAETDAFGDVQMPTGLYVKNTGSDAVEIGGVYTIVSISNGMFQSCPFGNCTASGNVGEHETTHGSLGAGELSFLASEWIPNQEGTCQVVYQLFSYKQNPITKKWAEDKAGPTITLNFNYGTTSISSIHDGKQVISMEYYDLSGQRVSVPVRGLYIVKTTYADGTTRSVKLNTQY